MNEKTVYKQLLISLYCFLLLQCQSPTLMSDKKTAVSDFSLPVEAKSCEAAYIALELEEWAGLPVRMEEYWLVNRFLDSLAQYLQAKQLIQSFNPQAMLRLIGEEIARHRARQVSYHHAFYLCLRYRLFDCDINSLLYLTAADRFGLPIQMLWMPKHASVVWQDERDTVYWETTLNRAVSIQEYIDWYQLDTAQIGKNLLLKPLTRRELLGVLFFNLGQTYSEAHNYPLAVQYIRHALTLTGDWLQPYYSLAHIYPKMNQWETAIYYANRVLKWQPDSFQIYKILANSYVELGCNTEAIAAYQNYVQFLPNKTYDYPKIKQEINKKINSLD